MYSDITEVEYDYDEELYDEDESEAEARAVPTDPLGTEIRLLLAVKSVLVRSSTLLINWADGFCSKSRKYSGQKFSTGFSGV